MFASGTGMLVHDSQNIFVHLGREKKKVQKDNLFQQIEIKQVELYTGSICKTNKI